MSCSSSCRPSVPNLVVSIDGIRMATKSLLLWNQQKFQAGFRVKISFQKLDSTYIWLYDLSAAKRTLQTPFFLAQLSITVYAMYIHKHIQTKTYKSIQYIFTKLAFPLNEAFYPRNPNGIYSKSLIENKTPSCFVDKRPTQKLPGVHSKMQGKFSRENQPMHLSTTGRDISRKALFLSLGFQNPWKFSQ